MGADDILQQVRDWFANIGQRFQRFVERTKAYFNQLNAYEQYGWLAEGFGFVIFIVGVVLLIL